VEGTRVRDGDEVIAVVPGSTLDHVAFFAEDGTSYTMRINEVPASSGYGEPITKFFKIADQVKIIAAETTDERFLPASMPPAAEGDPDGPYLLTVTSDGMTLRTPYAAYRAASTKNGRRYIRLTEGERVVMVRVLGHEESIFLASEDARLIHFRLDQISLLSGAGKGVVGIRLMDKVNCLGGMLISKARDVMKVEASTGVVREFRPTSQALVNRGGRGAEILKRGRFLKIVAEAVELPDWESVDAGKNPGDVLKHPRPKREPMIGDVEADGAILF